MKKLKNLFDFGLFAEGLRQTRGLALTFIFIANLISVLMPAGIAVIYEDSGEVIEKLTLNNQPNFLHLYLIFLVLVPMLAYRLFFFLTARNACDFYHSIPHKRLALFNSYSAAVIFWLVVNTIVMALITLASYGIFGNYFDVSLPAVLSLMKLCLSVIICGSLITAVITLGCALSGKLVYSVILTLIFLIMPRLVLIIATFGIMVISPLFAFKPGFFIMDYNVNLLYASIFSADRQFISVVPMLYTAVLALIYYIIAARFFVKRRSELSGRLIHNKKMLGLSGLLLSLPFAVTALITLLYMISCFGTVFNPDGYSVIKLGPFLSIDTDVILIACMSFIPFLLQAEVFGLVVLVIYTLITGGRIKGFKHFFIPIKNYFLSQLIIFAIMFIIYYAGAYRPIPASIISYVSFPEYSSETYIGGLCDYQIRDCKFRDKEIHKIISDALNSDIQKTTFTGVATDFYDSAYYADELTISVKVAINSLFTTKYREIHLTSAEYMRLKSCIEGSEEYAKQLKVLPKYNSETMSICSPYNLSEDQMLKLYNIMDDELENISISDWLERLKLYEYNTTDYLRIDVDHSLIEEIFSARTGDIILPITELTPKTLEAYNEMIKGKTRID